MQNRQEPISLTSVGIYLLNIDSPQFLLVLSVNHRNVLIILLTEVIRDYTQQTFDERGLMGGNTVKY